MRDKQSGLTRRGILSGAAAASVSFWIPKPVKGYAPSRS